MVRVNDSSSRCWYRWYLWHRPWERSSTAKLQAQAPGQRPSTIPIAHTLSIYTCPARLEARSSRHLPTRSTTRSRAPNSTSTWAFHECRWRAASRKRTNESKLASTGTSSASLNTSIVEPVNVLGHPQPLGSTTGHICPRPRGCTGEAALYLARRIKQKGFLARWTGHHRHTRLSLTRPFASWPSRS